MSNHFVFSNVNYSMGWFPQVADHLPGEGMAFPTIRVVIADDDLHSCRQLRLLLSAEAGLNVVGECFDAPQTMAAIQKLEPDLLVIDMDLLDTSGWQALGQLRTGERPILVFTSTNRQNAIRAFEARALDYLVKPFDPDRVHVAAERTRAEVLRAHDRHLSHRILNMLAGSHEADAGRRLIVKSGSRVVFLESGEIDWIEAAGNYVRLRAGRESYLMREGISRMAQKLDSRQFVRIHRSTIVNVRRIKELQPNRGDYVVILKDGKELSCSRGYRAKLQALITSAS